MSESRKIILEIQDLDYYYRSDRKILENLSLKVEKGTRNVLLGSNGAGKSTLFFLLNGVYEPKKGKISFDEHEYRYDRKGNNFIRQKVGLVFQDPDVQLFASTVLDDVIFGPMNLGMTLPEAEAKARWALKEVGLEDYENEAPHILSHGQKKRVAIAGVLAMDPEIILMDEPTAGLDYEGTELLNRIIDQLTRQGKTLLISTHETDWALEWADYVYVLANEKIATEGKPEEILGMENYRELGFGQPILIRIFKELWQKSSQSSFRTIDAFVEKLRKKEF